MSASTPRAELSKVLQPGQRGVPTDAASLCSGVSTFSDLELFRFGLSKDDERRLSVAGRSNSLPSGALAFMKLPEGDPDFTRGFSNELDRRT
eukprot:6277591-Prymnesium_polylepis.1